MKRRIIRSFFITPLLLFVGGWAWSPKWGGWVYRVHAGRSYYCATGWGAISLPNHPAPRVPDGWDWNFESMESARVWPKFSPSFHPVLGFVFSRRIHSGNLWSVIYVPYWFPIVASSAALFFVWRKTRPTPTARAF